MTRAKKYEGALAWKGTTTQPIYGFPVEIRIAGRLDVFHAVGTLLHEMVHQYQYEVLKQPPDHDDTFRSYCKWIERQTGFQLRK